jgi:hypothetical protein
MAFSKIANLTTLTEIPFNSTQSASADVNTLDDYQEGTFTPTVGSITLAGKHGHYTKIGKQVSVQGYVSMGSQSGGTTVVVGGLPFTASASNPSVQFFAAQTNYGDSGPISLRIIGNSATAVPVSTDQHSDNNNSDFNYNDLNGKFFYFWGTYYV